MFKLENFNLSRYERDHLMHYSLPTVAAGASAAGPPPRHESIFCVANKGIPVLVEVTFPRNIGFRGSHVPVFVPNNEEDSQEGRLLQLDDEPITFLSDRPRLAWLANRNDEEIRYDFPDRSLVYFAEPLQSHRRLRGDYVAALADNRWMKVVDQSTLDGFS